MAPKQKVKMDLGSFLADESFGGSSWADEEVDLNSIGLSLNKPSTTTTTNTNTPAAFETTDSTTSYDNYPKKERVEYPVPDKPPYKAVVANLPYDLDEEIIIRHFESRMQAQDIISEVKIITERDTGRQKGFAFITFKGKNILEESLNLNLTDLNGRKIFVNVAAPPKAEDGDWRSSRNGPLGGRREREPQQELDWGTARSTQASLPQRERSNRRNDSFQGGLQRRESKDNFDWGTARSSQAQLPPRERSNRIPSSERTPRKQEPELDWGTARSAKAQLPPRENRSDRPEGVERAHSKRSFSNKKEEELDWGSARSAQTQLPAKNNRVNSQSNFKKDAPSNNFDWKRGQSLNNNKQSPQSQKQSQQSKKDNKKDADYQGPQKSSYSVLMGLDGDDEDEEEEQQEQEQVKSNHQQEEVKNLEEKTGKLSVSNEDNEGWEVVGK
ncbi:unnamed protein product [Candida verbasci]|uniref:RRM domain-containing protein n=1 Tax=Candida verbasci TaxID=1227364 RepID=A0A9W4XNM6_9ASCO|nr:unnamed protein product [Candida verbasci]